MRILVVDDDELDRLSVRRLLHTAGIAAEVDEAESADEALARIRSGAYDCMLLDYYIPAANTIVLLRSIADAVPDMPIVIFTGRGDEDVAVEFMKAGAADYLPKASLSPERLAASLRYAQNVSRVNAEQRQMQDSLREREAEFRTLANSIPQMAWVADTHGRRYWYNERWYEYTGLRPDESLGLGWYLVHHPDRRSATIASQAASFKSGETWEETVRLRRRDGAYRWFLARAVPVKDAQGAILRWVGTNTDITDQTEAQLLHEHLLGFERAARANAERASKARDDMLAIVAHDLRNPLQSIAAAAAVLGLVDDSKRERLIDAIKRSTAEIERLVADLLDVANIDAGTFAVEKGRVDLRGLLADVLERFQAQAGSCGVALSCEMQKSIPPVSADRGRLMQVLSNLLGNAMKFTAAGGTVRVKVGVNDECVLVSVEDTGVGISEENLPNIFDRYWQGDRSSRLGAGLGLAICKGIVEAHGGRIWAASTVGCGTTVHFTLPRQPEE